MGEPTLVDASDSNTNVIRYLAVSLCFFACNTVLMNILINVTGSVYLQETANAVGSLQAERLRICVEAVAGAHFTRCAVFIECLAGWGLWLILILAASNIWNALNILLAGLLASAYSGMWHGEQLPPWTTSKHRLMRWSLGLCGIFGSAGQQTTQKSMPPAGIAVAGVQERASAAPWLRFKLLSQGSTGSPIFSSWQTT